MRFFRWIKVFLQGGRCYRCKYFYNPHGFRGYCSRQNHKIRFAEDHCSDFEEMERKGK